MRAPSCPTPTSLRRSPAAPASVWSTKATSCKASDTTGIVVITQVRPISIFFNLPQQDLPELNKGLAEGPLPVDVFGADRKTPLDKGKVLVVDNQVDQTTGTVKVKAEFPNANLQLWPGQFVNVRVLIDTLRQVVVVPTAAIQRGPNGTFVYVVKDDNTVTVRRVTLTQQDDVRRRGRHRPASRRARWSRPDLPASPREHRWRYRARRTPGRSRPATGRARTAPAARAEGRRRSEIRARAAGHEPMSVSSPFIHRPIATSLLGVAVMLGGMLGYLWLPVSSLPQVDFPTIQVTTQLPGASPDVMASLVTAPLERNFGQIPSLAGDDLVELVRGQPDHAAVRPRPRDRRRRAGRAGRDQRVGLGAAAQPALPAGLLQGEPRRRADGNAGDHVGHHLAAGAQRHRRHACSRSG